MKITEFLSMVSKLEEEYDLTEERNVYIYHEGRHLSMDLDCMYIDYAGDVIIETKKEPTP